ncbi:hypothetical protein B0H66DRAFT_536115 [Apodospora peruviana]|uniref:Uncharacterized protein n=1 Tax=Apodospora peruviana TaxID=516989 RepID=A0AAE0M177_9PEZI|nr:hypothetical protein B0H66DRAFT_536115 [Apodospora peruviana]
MSCISELLGGCSCSPGTSRKSFLREHPSTVLWFNAKTLQTRGIIPPRRKYSSKYVDRSLRAPGVSRASVSITEQSARKSVKPSGELESKQPDLKSKDNQLGIESVSAGLSLPGLGHEGTTGDLSAQRESWGISHATQGAPPSHPHPPAFSASRTQSAAEQHTSTAAHIHSRSLRHLYTDPGYWARPFPFHGRHTWSGIAEFSPAAQDVLSRPPVPTRVKTVVRGTERATTLYHIRRTAYRGVNGVYPPLAMHHVALVSGTLGGAVACGQLCTSHAGQRETACVCGPLSYADRGLHACVAQLCDKKLCRFSCRLSRVLAYWAEIGLLSIPKCHVVKDALLRGSRMAVCGSTVRVRKSGSGWAEPVEVYMRNTQNDTVRDLPLDKRQLTSDVGRQILNGITAVFATSLSRALIGHDWRAMPSGFVGFVGSSTCSLNR